MFRYARIQAPFAAIALVLAAPASGSAQALPSPPTATARSAFTVREVMIPMRDGARLQTVIMTPTEAAEPLPILLRRSPYGVPEAADNMPSGMPSLVKDGYIFVFQNLRGRFKSEGIFQVSTKIDLSDPKAINEATDGYDTIAWLVANLPGTNGKVGQMGISYSGLTAGMALLAPHPALAAVSDQAAPTDLYMNDDTHRYGALRLSYAFEFAVLEQSEKHANAPFKFDHRDTYDWYLKLGALANSKRYLTGKLQVWDDLFAHPDYDAYWKEQAWAERLAGAKIPTLTVAGFWDEEDPWGPWQVYQALERHDPNNINSIVAGPWTHGSWASTKGDRLGQVPLGGRPTGEQFLNDIQARFFRYWLHGKGDHPDWSARIFETGSNQWRNYASWPPRDARPTPLYFHSDGTLSFTAPSAAEAKTPYRAYVSDPANPVPYRPRPITPTFVGDASAKAWEQWETFDQRFVDHRPDVLSYVSAPLDRDIRITGEVAANLVASTSGTDSDFVVKLIDVYPEEGVEEEMRGYQLPIAMEIRRGRYLKDFGHPQALKPNVPIAWDVPLRDRDHVFLKGHRIMVQVQSSWFPVIDRNPQRFVPSIYAAKDSDFVKATQRVYSEPGRLSFISLPLAP